MNFDVTNSKVINNAYEDFYRKHGYIPRMFNPYNCSEIIDIAPTITSACGVTTTSATILIIEERWLRKT